MVAITAVMLIGVPGRLTKKTLSPSSLAISSDGSAPAETDLARTSIGLWLPSENTRLNPFPALVVKNCAYSGSLSVEM